VQGEKPIDELSDYHHNTRLQREIGHEKCVLYIHCFITERMIRFHGGNTPDMLWLFEKGVPQKLMTRILDKRAAREGSGTYEKQGLDWVKVQSREGR